MMHRMTTLGLDERVERVLAYLFFWVSGIVLFFVEKNRNVRWHAAQSMLVFGTLSILMFAVSMLQHALSIIPVLSILTNAGLSLLYNILFITNIILWLWLMVMAALRPNYRLPFVSNWVSYFI